MLSVAVKETENQNTADAQKLIFSIASQAIFDIRDFVRILRKGKYNRKKEIEFETAIAFFTRPYRRSRKEVFRSYAHFLFMLVGKDRDHMVIKLEREVAALRAEGDKVVETLTPEAKAAGRRRRAWK